MIVALKLACLLVYCLAAAKTIGVLPLDAFPYVRAIALLLLVLHLFEMVFAFRHIRRYPGPLAKSLLLTLVYGALHWYPLKRDAARDAADRSR